MARAHIDTHVLARLLATQLKAALGSTADLFIPGEMIPEDLTKPWVMLDGVDLTRLGGSKGGDSGPDEADVEVRCAIFLPDADTITDLAQAESISALVSSALSRQNLSDSATTHFLDLFDPREGEATATNESRRIRGRSVTVQGRAIRLIGTSLE